MRRTIRRILVVLVVAALLGVKFGAAHATAWNTSCETYMVNHVNAARHSHGLRDLTVTNYARYEARKWSAWMASHHTLAHDPNLSSEFKPYHALGQNVGEGGTCSSVWYAFMRSPEHRANILSHQYTRLGVGVVFANGVDWITQDFKEP